MYYTNINNMQSLYVHPAESGVLSIPGFNESANNIDWEHIVEEK